MKKIILLVVAVVVAAIPAVPYYIGTTIEQGFKAEHNVMAKEAMLSGFDVELIDYQRDLFTASATTRITLAMAGEKEAPTVDIHHEIDHTPQPLEQIVATIISKPVMTEKAKADFAKLFKEQAPLLITSHLFLDGHQESEFVSPTASNAFEKDDSTIAVNWKGLTGTLLINKARNQATFEITSPGVELNQKTNNPSAAGKAGSFTFGETTYQGKMYRGESGLWHGSATASVASLNINANDPLGEPIAFDVDTIDITGEQSESHGLMKASGAMTIKQITVADFVATNAKYDVAIRNIDTGAMRAWQVAMAKAMRSNQADANPFIGFADHVPTLINAHPGLTINEISVETPLGNFHTSLDAELIGEWNDAMKDNPALLSSILKAKFSAALPREAVTMLARDNMRNKIAVQMLGSEQTMTKEEIEQMVNQAVEQQIGGLLAQGFIKEQETQLATTIEFNAGQLMVNGQDASQLMGTVTQ